MPTQTPAQYKVYIQDYTQSGAENAAYILVGPCELVLPKHIPITAAERDVTGGLVVLDQPLYNRREYDHLTLRVYRPYWTKLHGDWLTTYAEKLRRRMIVVLQDFDLSVTEPGPQNMRFQGYLDAEGVPPGGRYRLYDHRNNRVEIGFDIDETYDWVVGDRLKANTQYVDADPSSGGVSRSWLGNSFALSVPRNTAITFTRKSLNEGFGTPTYAWTFGAVGATPWSAVSSTVANPTVTSPNAGGACVLTTTATNSYGAGNTFTIACTVV